MKAKTERVRKVTRSYVGVSVFKKGSNPDTDAPVFFPNMTVSQIEVLSENLELDMTTAEVAIRRYSMDESEFLKMASME